MKLEERTFGTPCNCIDCYYLSLTCLAPREKLWRRFICSINNFRCKVGLFLVNFASFLGLNFPGYTVVNFRFRSFEQRIFNSNWLDNEKNSDKIHLRYKDCTGPQTNTPKNVGSIKTWSVKERRGESAKGKREESLLSPIPLPFSLPRIRHFSLVTHKILTIRSFLMTDKCHKWITVCTVFIVQIVSVTFIFLICKRIPELYLL